MSVPDRAVERCKATTTGTYGPRNRCLLNAIIDGYCRQHQPDPEVDRVVSAAREAFANVRPISMPPPWQRITKAVEAAAPYIIEQHKEEIEAFIEELADTKTRELRGVERFIDGLTWERITNATQRAAQKLDFTRDPDGAIQAELKRLIPTPEFKRGQIGATYERV